MLRTLTLLITIFVLCLSILVSPLQQNLHAWKYSTDVGGGGYQEARTAAVLAPATLFLAVVLGGILAIVLKTERTHRHSHCHVHTHAH
jgi:ABC-type Fe3+ transport system permease subunit